MPPAKKRKVIYRACPECGGDGVISLKNYNADGSPVTNETVCPNCNGGGKILWGEIVEE